RLGNTNPRHPLKTPHNRSSEGSVSNPTGKPTTSARSDSRKFSSHGSPAPPTTSDRRPPRRTASANPAIARSTFFHHLILPATRRKSSLDRPSSKNHSRSTPG